MKGLLLWVILLGIFISFADLSAQLIGGGFVERSFESTEARDGLGAELGLEVAFLPVDVFISGTHFPATHQDPSNREWSLGARATIIPIPFLNSYMLGGLNLKEYRGSASGKTGSEDGHFLGAGVSATLRSFKVYAESKYAFQSTSSMRIRLGASLLWGGLNF